MTVKVSTIATLPDELAHAWLQHLRDFDVAHPGCHFEVVADAPDKTITQMVEMLRIEPGLNSLAIFPKADKDPPDT